MIDWVNAFLRAIMCFAFLMIIVRPMLAALSRKDVNQLEIEDAAQSSVNSAFDAWRNNHGFHYYDNPEYAEMMASNPNLELPDLSKPQVAQLPAPETQVEESSEVPEVQATQELSAEETASVGTPAETSTEVETVLASANEEKTEDAALSKETKPEVEEEEEDDSMEKIKAQLASEKKKKKQQAIPTELLNANSYEDKLMLVRMLVEQDQGRVSGVLKKMIQG